MSHLCGNQDCFNSDHVIIEPAYLNELRKECQNGVRVECECGAVYELCDHKWAELQLQCVKPTVRGRRGTHHHLARRQLVNHNGQPNGR